MRKAIPALFCAFALSFFATNICHASNLTDGQIRQILIRESLASYPGSCPCPYNTDRAGHSCGRRSAYSKPGGYAPLCYPQDVTEEMIERYRADR